MNSLLFNTPVLFNIHTSDININLQLISKAAGYPDGKAPDYFLEEINKEFNKALNFAKINAAYFAIEEKNFTISNSLFTINDINFYPGKIILNQLKNSTGIILFLATVGTYFDNSVKKAFKDNDFIKALILDTIGSEMVEYVCSLLEKFLTEEFNKKGYKLSNRLSPGYCEWNVSEQKKLFSFFPKNFCNIKLNKSFMMSPIKSVSGIIGYGKNVKKMEYSCKICGMDYCYKRNLIYT